MTLFDLAWLIPAFPFLAFLSIALGAHRNRRLSHRLAIGGMGLSFLLAQVVFWTAALCPAGVGQEAYHSAGVPWLPAGEELFYLGIYVDAATAVMLFMVPLVCLLIFIYSVGYMRGDPEYGRFFAYISLLATGMLGLVVFDNLLTFFIFWEIMGICSYLLIGFWREKPAAYTAGLKAFLVSRVGDVLFLLGLVFLYARVGSLHYDVIFSEGTLAALASPGFLGTPLAPATLIALLFFGGTVGKSAQFPLHVWLPDAVEGPTPVSALLQAATTVPAGVFLIIRAFPLFAATAQLSLPPLWIIGAFTALFASLIAVAQDDIRRVLAFSTISQLGYMVAALGIGAYVAATFHLITHAFFKALLLLASGSVMRALEHVHHELHAGPGGDPVAPFDPHDMFNMGGLAKRMPRTAATFLIGGLSLSGFPLLTAGFWSKDEILARAWPTNPLVFWVLAISAGLTAFYTARQLSLIFLGQPRTAAAAHVEENVPSMTVPLLLLAACAVVLGWVGITEPFPVIGGVIPNWFEHFIAGAQMEAASEAQLAVRLEGFAWQPLVLSVAFVLGGLGLGWLVYGWRPLEAGRMDRVAGALQRLRMGRLYRAAQRRFYVDELYQATVVRAGLALAALSAGADRTLVDGGVRQVAAGARALSRGAARADERVIDGVVDLSARFTRTVSGVFARFDAQVIDGIVNMSGGGSRHIAQVVDWIDTHAIDGLANLVGGISEGVTTLGGRFDDEAQDTSAASLGNLVGSWGRLLRPVQTGRVRDYLWLALLSLLALVITFSL
ncbi:MAG: NADH-quinone oxidoreductase subunit L [Anaerolineales bacterium]